jgi:hypothetical protein
VSEPRIEVTRALPFPLPGEKLAGRVVIASVEYIADERGEIALLLMLEPSPPYYTLTHYALTAFDPAANPDILPPYGPAYGTGEFDVIGRFENIVPAVDEYQQNGGDY